MSKKNKKKKFKKGFSAGVGSFLDVATGKKSFPQAAKDVKKKLDDY